MKVIILDDEEEIVKLLSRYLSGKGYKPLGTTCPKEALRFIEQGEAMLLITDLAMPAMSGLDVIKEAKNLNGLVQIIMITGCVTLDAILTAFRRGANNCFFKPLQQLELLKDELDLAVSKLNRIQGVLRELRGIPKE